MQGDPMSNSDKIYLTLSEISTIEGPIITHDYGKDTTWVVAKDGWMYEDMQALADAELAWYDPVTGGGSYPKERWVFKTYDEIMRDHKPFIYRNNESSVAQLRALNTRTL